MTWFAFHGKNNGKAIDLAGVQEKDAVTIGFHGYGTEAQAEKQPNSVNVITGGEADLLISDYAAAVREKAQPGGKNASNPVAAAVQGDASYAKSAASAAASATGINAIGNFFGGLSQKNTWIRVGKISIGGVMILIAVSKLTGAGSVISKIPVPIPV